MLKSERPSIKSRTMMNGSHVLKSNLDLHEGDWLRSEAPPAVHVLLDLSFVVRRR